MAESISGFHFISTYQKCPRLFMLKYVYHLEPEFKHPALLFGIAIHAALESWAKADLNKAIYTFQDTLVQSESDYEKKEVYLADLHRGPLILKAYEETYREHDTETYELVGTEIPFEVKLPNNFVFTGRIDRLVRDKRTKDVFVIETKTTGYSAAAMAHTLIVGDQVTAYLFGAKKTMPDLNVVGVIPDVLYNRNSVIRCERFDPIYRTDRELREFELQILGQLMTISQKVQSLKDYPWSYLFPRNCGASIFKCEYEDICRLNLKANDIPIGFKKEKGSEEIVNNLMDINNIHISIADAKH